MIASLSLESVYSFNGSNITLDAIFSYAKEKKHTYVALSDYTMHGAYKFLSRAKKSGLIPILGLKSFIENHYSNEYLHATFYARNLKGYKNLLKLASIQSVYDYITYDALSTHNEGVSVVLNSKVGELKNVLDQDNELLSLIDTLKTKVTFLYLDSKNSFNLPYIELNYVMYHSKHDYDTYELLANLMHKTALKEEEINPLVGTELTLDSKTKEFINNHSLTFELPLASLPKYKTKENISSDRYLRALSIKGLEKRLNKSYAHLNVYKKRLEKELTVIHDMGFDDYFLIIWDLIKYAKKENILVGPGRGSAPGSLVSYALGITSIDPIHHDLLFERFLNKARKTMPDIDIDFPDDKREDIVKYLKQRYGSEYVALICTFGTFLKKSALRDSARALNIETKFVDEMAKKVVTYDSIAQMIKEDEDVQNRIKTYKDTGKWLNIAQKIEGLPRHVSTHAAGVMISEVPLFEYTALQEGLNTLYQTQYEQSDLEAMGLLKIDVLGLKNLTMIEAVLKRIKENEEQTIDLQKIPLNDETTFKMLRHNSTTGIFQLESMGMRRLIKQLKIGSFSDIAIALALYRPGPMESIPVFLERRFKKAKIEKLEKRVDPILERTHGILLYQEQIMKIATDFAGYSLNDADILRRAVSKKDSVILESERKRFVSNALKLGHKESLGNKIYDYIVKFANYGFNKSHSVAYGLIAYWMAYLKANYPHHFLSVLMNNALNNESQMKIYTQEIHDYGLALKGPNIEKSGFDFTMEDKTLFYPLTGIKTLGKRTIKAFLEIKTKAMFGGFEAFILHSRGIFTKRNYEYLIYSGAFDLFNVTKKTMVENLESLLSFIDFDQALPLEEFVMNHYQEYDSKTLKAMEKDALGFNIHYDNLTPYLHWIQQNGLKMPSDVETLPLNQKVSLVGLLSKVKVITTKKGDPMAFLSIEDKTTTLDSVCFPQTYKHLSNELIENKVYLLKGKVALKSDKRQFIIDSIKDLNV